MPRTMLTDQSWLFLLNTMKNTGRIYDKSEHRMTFEGVIPPFQTAVIRRNSLSRSQ